MISDAISRSNDGAKGLQRLPRAHHCSETTLSRNDEGQVPRESDQPDACTITPGIARVDDSDHGSCQSSGRDEYVGFSKQVISIFLSSFLTLKIQLRRRSTAKFTCFLFRPSRDAFQLQPLSRRYLWRSGLSPSKYSQSPAAECASPACKSFSLGHRRSFSRKRSSTAATSNAPPASSQYTTQCLWKSRRQ